MGLVHWLQAWVEMPAKSDFMLSIGFHQTGKGDWVTDFNESSVNRREYRRLTLKELKDIYSRYGF